MNEHEPSQPRYLDGAKLRLARLSRGMTQAALADQAGTSRGNLSRHEHKRWGCHPDLLARYADVLGVELTDLTRDDIAA